MKSLKSSWPVIVFSVLITLIGNFVFTSFISREEKIESSVTKDYVDEKDSEIIHAFRQGDKQVKDYCIQEIGHLKETQDYQFKLLLDEIRINRQTIKELK